MLNRITRIFLTIGLFIVGFILSGIGFTVRLDPYWMNSIFFLGGVLLEIGTIIYAISRLIKRFN